MNTEFSILSFVPLILIILLNAPVFLILSQWLRRKDLIIFFAAAIICPFLLAVYLYGLLFAFPGQDPIFYDFALVGMTISLLFSTRRRLPGYVDFVKEQYRKLRPRRWGGLSKVMAAIVFFIIILAVIRTVLWPINFADQIWYVEQSYIFSKIRSLGMFFSWGFYQDERVDLQMNPAIRPAMPMVYLMSFLFSNSWESVQIYVQLISLYFALSLAGIVFYLTASVVEEAYKIKAGLLAILVLLSTYLFFNNAVSGYKEVQIAAFTILAIGYIARISQQLIRSRDFIFLGVLLGVMSFINYSGIVISGILILVMVFTKSQLAKKLLGVAQMLATITVASCLEVVFFIKFIVFGFQLTAISNSNAPASPAAVVPTPPASSSTTSPPSGLSDTNQVSQAEYSSYSINNITDIYLKGKLQGLFQVQFYGIVFWLLLAVVLFNFRNIIKNPLTKLILIFMVLYFMVIMDPLSLNKHYYAHVLTVSHKYTVFLVPFAAIIIGSRWQWVYETVSRIKIHLLAILAVSGLVVDFFYLSKHLDKVLDMVELIVPIHQNLNYYIGLVRLAELLARGGLLFLFACIIFYYIYHKKKAARLWQEGSYSFLLFLAVFFLFPFFFFFNTNYGFRETFAFSFSGKSTKLAHVKGWEDQYLMVNRMNELPKDQQKVLFLDQGIWPLMLHLDIPVSKTLDRLEFESDLSADNLEAVRQSMVDYGVGYVFAKVDSKIGGLKVSDLPYMQFVQKEKESVFYKVNF